MQDYEFQSLEVPKFLKFCGIGKQLEEIFLYGTYSFYMNAEKVCSASVAFLFFVSKTTVNETDGNNELFCLCLCEC